MPSDKTKRISVNVPVGLHRDLRMLCAMDEITMGRLVTDLIRDHIREHKSGLMVIKGGRDDKPQP